jgi:DNA-binding NtrC family response regulator
MADASDTVLVANPDAQVREVLARIVELTGRTATRLDIEGDTDVAAAVVASGAVAVVLDLGSANLAALQAIRSRPEPVATSTCVLVIGTGPAGGRLAWQSGADGFLVRPFHSRDLQTALIDALARDDAARVASSTEQGGGRSA